MADPRDGPPTEEGPHTDAAEAGHAAVVEVPCEAVVEGGEVAPGGQDDAAAGSPQRRKLGGRVQAAEQ